MPQFEKKVHADRRQKLSKKLKFRNYKHDIKYKYEWQNRKFKKKSKDYKNYKNF